LNDIRNIRATYCNKSGYATANNIRQMRSDTCQPAGSLGVELLAEFETGRRPIVRRTSKRVVNEPGLPLAMKAEDRMENV